MQCLVYSCALVRHRENFQHQPISQCVLWIILFLELLWDVNRREKKLASMWAYTGPWEGMGARGSASCLLAFWLQATSRAGVHFTGAGFFIANTVKESLCLQGHWVAWKHTVGSVYSL